MQVFLSDTGDGQKMPQNTYAALGRDDRPVSVLRWGSSRLQEASTQDLATSGSWRQTPQRDRRKYPLRCKGLTWSCRERERTVISSQAHSQGNSKQPLEKWNPGNRGRDNGVSREPCCPQKAWRVGEWDLNEEGHACPVGFTSAHGNRHLECKDQSKRQRLGIPTSLKNVLNPKAARRIYSYLHSAQSYSPTETSCHGELLLQDIELAEKDANLSVCSRNQASKEVAA